MEIPKTGEGQTSLRQQTYLRLKDLIVGGDIRPGDRLQEAQVAAAFGISRSPARQALTLLDQAQLVEPNGKRGYRVRGAIAPGHEGRLAELGSTKLSVARQWELIYKEVEQDLFVRMLFGTVRINEMRLAQHLGVSRTVTRDLLAHMHGTGMIGRDATGHWVARQVTPEAIRHHYQMRLILEPCALRSSAPGIPPAMLQTFRANILAAKASDPLDSALFDELEHDLHIRALQYCSNPEILNALARTHFLFGPTRYLANDILGIPLALIQAAIDEHLQVIDLLIANDVERAALALQAHLEAAVDRWLQRFHLTAPKVPLALPPYLTEVMDDAGAASTAAAAAAAL